MAFELLAGSRVSDGERDAMQLVREGLRLMQELSRSADSGASQPPVTTGTRGRPIFQIRSEQLNTLLENGFTVPQIAGILRVYISTVHRRMSEYGLSVRAMYAEISDDELDQLVRDVNQTFPMCENKQMVGHLQARGYRIQQGRIRDAQRRVDPGGVAMQ